MVDAIDRRPRPKPLAAFEEYIQGLVPTLDIAIDAPDDDNGMFWIEIAQGTFRCTVTWSRQTAFGFFTDPDSGFGDRPNERYKTWELAAARFRQLWSRHNDNDQQMRPPRLPDVRALLDVTQVEVAQILGISQNAVSKFEKRDDPKLSTLTQWAKAMGGTCEVRMHFPEFDCPIVIDDDATEAA